MPQGGTSGGRREYKPRARKYETEPAKSKLIELVQDGLTIQAACDKVGYSRKWYEAHRRQDAAFAAKVDQARQLRKRDPEAARGEKLGFAEWRKKYLNTETFWHQLQWVDILEGRDPRDLHPKQQYTLGKRSRVIVTVPPFHAKSMTITVDYVVYRLCMDPSFRAILVSQTSTLAEDFLYAIKNRLDSPDYIELQKAYAPDGGWKATSEQWTNTRIVFGNDQREGGEKDPNVQAIGIGSQIYGRRADLIILDDAVTGKNVSEWSKQMTWLRREVASRLEMGKGKLLVVGTRIAPVDLYSELMNPEHYAKGKVPWTHFASPAILEEGKTPEEHVTLWPYATQAWSTEDDECDCGKIECSQGIEVDGQVLYPRWDGVHLEIGPRADNNSTEWALVYQQESVSQDATFPEHAVAKSINGSRQPGPLKANTVGHPPMGMNGMYVIGGCDPAVKGNAGLIVMAVDRETQKRYVLTAWNLKAPKPDELKAKMRELTVEYGIHEWRVEKTGLLQFFTQDSEFRLWFSSRGVRFTEHTTGSNKWSPEYGVASMASLFGEYDRAWDDPNSDWLVITEPLIELPRAQNSDGLKVLRHQLVIWTPDLDPNKIPCDLVMALWFAEVGARERLGHGVSGNVTGMFGRSSRFVSPRATTRTGTYSLVDFRADSH